jgi:uncharacterized OsmC-like protein
MVMGRIGTKLGLDLRGAKVEFATTMADTTPPRLSTLTLKIALPRRFSAAQEAELKKAVEMCPVRNSLRPEVKVEAIFT